MGSADVNLVGLLLSHVGQPSMLVTGRRSALPPDDRVGVLLNHITPSMGARLARSALGEPRQRPRLVGAAATDGPPSMARTLKHKATSAKADPLGGLMGVRPSRLACRLRCEFRSAPVEPSGTNGAARAYSEAIDAPAEPQRSRSSPPLGWPWLDPPPTAPPVPPARLSGPAGSGESRGAHVDLLG